MFLSFKKVNFNTCDRLDKRKPEREPPRYASHGKKHDTRHLIKRIVSFTREKNDTRHLVGFQHRQPRRVVSGVHLKIEKGENICNGTK